MKTNELSQKSLLSFLIIFEFIILLPKLSHASLVTPVSGNFLCESRLYTIRIQHNDRGSLDLLATVVRAVGQTKIVGQSAQLILKDAPEPNRRYYSAPQTAASVHGRLWVYYGLSNSGRLTLESIYLYRLSIIPEVGNMLCRPDPRNDGSSLE